MNIMIVEDDKDINNLIYELLKGKYDIFRAFRGDDAIKVFDENKIDLVILDLMLPGLNGEEILKYINGRAKVIILSAKSAAYDKVRHLLNGANDYITKPFNNQELLARIDVQLRDLKRKEEVINIGEVTIDPLKMMVMINNNEIKLTKLEYQIIYLLMLNPNRVYSRSSIFEKIWDYEAIGNEDCIKVHISNIRNKIKEHTDINYIETVWGVGFKFLKI